MSFSLYQAEAVGCTSDIDFKSSFIDIIGRDESSHTIDHSTHGVYPIVCMLSCFEIHNTLSPVATIRAFERAGLDLLNTVEMSVADQAMF